MALLRTRQFYAATRYFRSCIAERAGGIAWFYLAAAQHALGQREEAASSFGRAADYGARIADARCARATVLSELGETAQAEQELRAVVAQYPAHARALSNLGILLEQRGSIAEALAVYGEAIETDPADYAARLNRGAMRLARAEPELALEDFNALLTAHDRAEIHTSRARALFALHRDQEALHAADRALALEPTNARAWLDKLLALSSLRKLDEASLTLQQAVAAAGDALLGLPDGPRRIEELDPSILFVDRALQRQDVCAWADRDDVLKAIRALLQAGTAEKLADPGMLFRMLALPFTSAELKAVGEIVARRVRARTHSIDPPSKAAGPRDRIRIGFVSPEFRPHPGAWLLRRLFLDRDRGRFEFFAYALNADDGSDIRSELASASDAFVDVSACTTEEIVSRMRADLLDLLVDTSGFFAGTRPELLAARVAPVQAGYVGIACTLGPGLLDYRISDALTTPVEAQDQWYEKLVILPAPHLIYDAGQPVCPATERQTHGLPESGFVFCCFNQAFKLSPEIYSLWMRLLLRVPASVLWLLDSGALVRDSLLQEARRAGVAAERLVFAPRVGLAEHLGRMRQADLFLDTLHYGAHTTAADALYAGVPVLTCPGETMASRVGATLVRCAGIGDLAVDTLAAYEGKAVELAEDPAELSRVRLRLAQARASAPMFATVERVRAVERAFVAMVERNRAGLPPDTLIID